MMKPLFATIRSRRLAQWLYALATALVLALGWKYPALGFMVLAAMAGGLVSAVAAGRWFCGNLCFRGGFLERVFPILSSKRRPPSWLRSLPVRLGFIVLMFAMMIVNIAANPGDWRQWGLAFWSACLASTCIGFALSMFFTPRAWCAVCPMGSIQNWFNRRKYSLVLDAAVCRRCRRCERSCPMRLDIITYSDPPAILESNDCICCGECFSACPWHALRMEARR